MRGRRPISRPHPRQRAGDSRYRPGPPARGCPHETRRRCSREAVSTVLRLTADNAKKITGSGVDAVGDIVSHKAGAEVGETLRNGLGVAVDIVAIAGNVAEIKTGAVANSAFKKSVKATVKASLASESAAGCRARRAGRASCVAPVWSRCSAPCHSRKRRRGRRRSAAGRAGRAP